MLTDNGWEQYKIHQSHRRKIQVRRIFIILSLIWICAAAVLAIYLLK